MNHGKSWEKNDFSNVRARRPSALHRNIKEKMKSFSPSIRAGTINAASLIPTPIFSDELKPPNMRINGSFGICSSLVPHEEQNDSFPSV